MVVERGAGLRELLMHVLGLKANFFLLFLVILVVSLVASLLNEARLHQSINVVLSMLLCCEGLSFQLCGGLCLPHLILLGLDRLYEGVVLLLLQDVEVI